jgi:hypothetical protein
MKKTPASLRSDAPAAISETGGRNGTKSLAELSEIPSQRVGASLRDGQQTTKDPSAPWPAVALSVKKLLAYEKEVNEGFAKSA